MHTGEENMGHGIHVRDLLPQSLANLLDGLGEIDPADESDPWIRRDLSLLEGKGPVSGPCDAVEGVLGRVEAGLVEEGPA